MGVTKLQNVRAKFWEYVVFIIWPFLAFMLTLKNLTWRRSKSVIVLFFGLFGFTFIYDDSSDSSRHAISFYSIADSTFSDFILIITGLYSEEGPKPDFVMDFIAFVVSRFTGDTKIYFMVLSLLLGWMLVMNINMFHKAYNKNRNFMSFLFLLFFLVLMPPVRLLSFRHYLALLVFTYSIYKYFNERKIIYLLLLTSSIFIHFGFLMVVALFYIYKLLGNRNIIYYVLIVLSFLFSELSTTFLRQLGDVFYLGGFEQIVSGYTNEKYLIRVSELQLQRNTILNFYISWTTFFMLISIIYHKFYYKKFDLISENIYSFLLLFFAFLNFSTNLESVANRFGVVFQVLGCIYYIHLYATNKIKANFLFNGVATIFLCLNLVILLRITIQYANMLMLTPFLPVSFFVTIDYTILDMIK